jgi:hypothetical protein
MPGENTGSDVLGVTARPLSPLALSGKTAMTFTAASTCRTMVVKKPAFTGTSVAF